MGKAEYASPELVLGDVRNHNYTTDIYALGILLFRLIVGKLPFTGPQYEVQQKQLKSKVPTRQIEDVALAKVVKKATEKTQSSRYSTVAEFRVAIDAAAKDNRKGFPQWIYVLTAVLIGVVVISFWIRPKPPTVTDQDRFNYALSLLNSDISDSVKAGFSLMRELARVDYDSAKIELGLTYFPYLKASNMEDSLLNPILKRRYFLELTSSNDADSVIRYLQKPTNLPPEAAYILGCTYYKKEKDEQQALTMFRKAIGLLDNNVAVGHGYDGDSLKKILNDNIRVLTDEPR